MGDINAPRADARETVVFTVFTPTFNRAHTLHRVYDSLRDQTFRDFEWLIVDDGSTDGTADLVASWQHVASFPIRYLWQENRGKHGSMRRAIQEARGELFLTADSDDTFVPHALERLHHHWRAIPAERRGSFSAVTALVADSSGRVVGSRFPCDPMDSNALEIRYRHKVKGEKWGFQRTSVLREHLPPEIPGYRGLVPESLIWNSIAREYSERFVNEILRTYMADAGDQLSQPAADPADIAPGVLPAYEALLNEDIRWFRFAPLTFFVEAARYSRLAFHAGLSAVAQWSAIRSGIGRVLWVISLPVGFLVFQLERHGLRPGRRRDPARRGSIGHHENQ